MIGLVVSGIFTICFFIFYYHIRTVEYTIEKIISYPENTNEQFHKAAVLWQKRPSDYKINQLIKLDSSYSYVKEHFEDLDFSKNDFFCSNRRKITSIFWSPSLGDEYYKLTDTKYLPVFVTFDFNISNNIYIYKIPKGKYRLSQKMDFTKELHNHK